MARARYELEPKMARQLADIYGTPLYVLDEAGFRARLKTYRETFASAWHRTHLSYASKANSLLAVLRVAHEEGYGIDVASEGELRAALMAGVPARHCHFHGNGKLASEIEFAVEAGVGHFVADSFEEIGMLGRMSPGCEIMLRLAPGVLPLTHKAISTGQPESKFGFNIADGSADRAFAMSLELGLKVLGVHCHIGSQLLEPEAQCLGAELITQFAIAMKVRHDWMPERLNFGGGLGIRYTDQDQPFELEDYNLEIVDRVRLDLETHFPHVILCQEPGRAVIGEAGVTLYSVTGVKNVPTMAGSQRYVSVDGGLSDNPRPLLYDAIYEAVGFASGDAEPCVLAGRHCETDTLIEECELPKNIKAGDLVQVLCTGAYNASMASNYNRFLRPACVMITDYGPELISRRETYDDLFSREKGL